MSANEAQTGDRAPTMAPPGQPLDDTEYRQASEWLYREAGLLARRDYDAWLALLAPELHYRVPSFLRYFVTNIEGTREGQTLRLSSQVLLLRVRANNPQPFLLSGERHDRLRPGGAGWLLAEREVQLDMPYLDAPNLALFI